MAICFDNWTFSQIYQERVSKRVALEDQEQRKASKYYQDAAAEEPVEGFDWPPVDAEPVATTETEDVPAEVQPEPEAEPEPAEEVKEVKKKKKKRIVKEPTPEPEPEPEPEPVVEDEPVIEAEPEPEPEPEPVICFWNHWMNLEMFSSLFFRNRKSSK